MPNPDFTPIIVEVKDGRWDAYSMNPEITERDQMLLATIQAMGGINESVTPGLWTFNIITMIGENTAMAQLLPLEK
jgi:hypothetical protein